MNFITDLPASYADISGESIMMSFTNLTIVQLFPFTCTCQCNLQGDHSGRKKPLALIDLVPAHSGSFWTATVATYCQAGCWNKEVSSNQSCHPVQVRTL